MIQNYISDTGDSGGAGYKPYHMPDSLLMTWS